jgi:hypothetical protein
VWRVVARGNYKKPQFNLSVRAHLLRADHSDQFSGDRRANTDHIFSDGWQEVPIICRSAFERRKKIICEVPRIPIPSTHKI